MQRVVNAFVRAARFGADEANRKAVFELWAKSGYPAEAFAEDFNDERLANRLTPLIDTYVIARYRDLTARVREYGLIRKDVDVDSWFEPHYLEAALKAQQLEHFWPHYDAAGKKAHRWRRRTYDVRIEMSRTGRRRHATLDRWPG